MTLIPLASSTFRAHYVRYLRCPEARCPEGRGEGGRVGRLVRRRCVHVAARAALELLLVALQQLAHLSGLDLVEKSNWIWLLASNGKNLTLLLYNLVGQNPKHLILFEP